MSKRSLFWGTAEGKLGETVFYRRKGEQCNRAYIARPANPRSNAQMEQRAKFANCVKFYKNAIQAYFKFAYEDKMPNESDYNAFMRHNTVANSALLTKQLVASNYPALGKNWVIASGRINGAEYLVNSSYSVRVYADGLTAGATTIGAISTALKAKYNLQEGDIVTVVKIKTTAKNPLPTSYAGQNPQWTIYQFSINTTSTDTLASLDDELVAFAGELQIGAGSDGANWFGMVFSRNTASGLQVSNATMQGNAYVDSLVAESETEAYKGRALQSWSASGRAILQGALLEESEGPQNPFIQTLTANNISVANGGSSAVLPNTAYNYTAQGQNLAEMTAEDITAPSGAVISNFNATANELAFTLTFGTVGGAITIGENFSVTAVMTSTATTVTSINGQASGGTVQLKYEEVQLEYVANGPILASQVVSDPANNFTDIKVYGNYIEGTVHGPSTLYIRDANDSSLTLFALNITIYQRFFIFAYSLGNGTVCINDGKESTQVSEQFYEGDTCELMAIPDEGYVFVNWTRHNQEQEISTNETYELTVTGGMAFDAHFREVE